MALILITLAGAALVGCFGATLGMDLAERGRRPSRRLARPRRILALQRD